MRAHLNGLEEVPDGFAEWTRDIGSIETNFAQRVDALLGDNNLDEALEVFDVCSVEFITWLKLMEKRNKNLFLLTKYCLLEGKLDEARDIFEIMTKDNPWKIWH